MDASRDSITLGIQEQMYPCKERDKTMMSLASSSFSSCFRRADGDQSVKLPLPGQVVSLASERTSLEPFLPGPLASHAGQDAKTPFSFSNALLFRITQAMSK